MTVKIKGMMCAGCENRVKNVLENLKGVQKVTANHNTGIVTITLNCDIPFDMIKETIEELGYEMI